MNNIVKTETSHPHNPAQFSLWIKHHFEDGSWICLFRPTRGWFEGQDPTQNLALDFGRDNLINGRIANEGEDIWTEFHTTINDIVNGEAAIVQHNYGEDRWGDDDLGVTIEAY